MSSILGHVAAGAIAYAAILPRSRSKAALSFCMVAAVLPDLDYLSIWAFQYPFRPRFTHSVVFCLLAAGVLWLVARRMAPTLSPFRLLAALAVASLSHPLLDLLVGVHPVPLLWPLPDPDVSLGFGVLPSAGRLQVDNIYLWRNLLIELGLFGPVLAFVVAARYGRSRRALLLVAGIAVPIFLGALMWSLQLTR